MKNLFLGDSVINLFFQVVPITVIVAVIYIILRRNYLKKKNASVNFLNELILVLFISYLTGLFNLVLVPANLWSDIWNFIFYGQLSFENIHLFEFNYNFVPTFFLIIRGEFEIGSWIKLMLFGNIIMYIPLGIFIALVFRKINMKNIFPTAILIPIVIELLQPLIGRSFDIDDIIMNFLGILLGFAFCKIILKIFKKPKEKPLC